MADVNTVVPAHLTRAILDLVAELDAGKSCELDEMKEAVRSREFFAWLRVNGVETLQFDVPEQDALLDAFTELLDEVNERRKFTIEKNGFALALAYLVEALQQRLAAAGLF